MDKLLTKNIDVENSHRIRVYIESGGYIGWKKVLSEMSPADVIETVKDSGLRGRGGAGFTQIVGWARNTDRDQHRSQPFP